LRGRAERRDEYAERRGFVPGFASGECPLWIQAASVGEVQLARRLVRELERALPDRPVVLSTTTRTGRALADREELGKARFFFPLDARPLVRRALDRLRPALFASVETEIWPHLLEELARRGIPSAIVSGRLSPRAFRRYRKVRSALGPALSTLSTVGAGSSEEARRFGALGVPEDRIVVTGNLKYDLEGGPLTVEDRSRRATELGLDTDRAVLVAGSTGPGEERLVLQAFTPVAKHPSRPVLLLAPRHPERFAEAADAAAGSGWPWARRSGGPAPPGVRVLVLDTLGELAELYGIARGAFVGGSLVPVGGHNLLEPAVRGVPVCFGPHVENFSEMSGALVRAGGGRRVESFSDLARVFGEWLDRPGEAARQGERGRQFVLSHRGATERTVDLLRKLLASPGSSGSGESAP
jgi:3-deoxy-D-manno-octulosonic-acid transferase